MKYIKKFATHAEYLAYINGSEVFLPNVSKCVDEVNVIHYNRLVVPNNEIWYASTNGMSSPVVIEIIRNIVDKKYSEDELTSILSLFYLTPEEAAAYAHQLIVNPVTVQMVVGLLAEKLGRIDTEEQAYLCELVENFVSKTNIEGNRCKLVFGASYSVTDIHTNSMKYIIPIGTNSSGLYDTLTEVHLPDSLTVIGKDAFSDCHNLETVTMAKNVTEIGEAAFCNCQSLANIRIPSTLEVLGNSAFKDCARLVSVVIPNGVEEIGANAFERCIGVKNVRIGNNVRIISKYAFSKCDMSSLTIPNSVTTLGNGAFSYCQSLESLVIGHNVESIGSWVFEGCENLTSITFNGTIAEWKNIEKGEDWKKFVPTNIIHCYDGDYYELPNNEILYTSTDSRIMKPNSSSVFGANIVSNTYADGRGVITFDGDVTQVGMDAFNHIDSLSTIILPQSVTSLGSGAFRACSNLLSIELPKQITLIDEYALSDCYKLTSMTIPSSVTRIGDDAFSGSQALTTITIEAINPPTLGTSAFISTQLEAIYVPSQSVNAYKSATNWSQYVKIIQAIPS